MISNKSVSPIGGFVYHFGDKSETDYDYYCYFSREGDMLISRVKKDDSEQKFAVFSVKDNPYETIWQTGAYKDGSVEYKLIYQLKL